jgi:PAS domain S-box-containing protein
MPANHEPRTDLGDILIVDDEIPNLQLLSELLTREGYQVRPAERPQLAIDSALSQPPALILLDVRMPEMDGFEVCRRLKEDKQTRDVPVLFISALHEVEDKLRGFEVGGVDFITKPFQEQEVLARVRTHIELRNIQLHLGEIVSKRTDELAKSEAKYRGLVDNSIVGVFISTIDGRFTFVNDAMAQMFDFDSPELMTAKGSLERWRDLKDRKRMLAELQKNGSVTNFEAEAITHADRPIHVIFSAKLLGDNIIGMVMDITDKKKGAEALQASREKAERLAIKLLSTQEAERSRLARELHDDITQRLAFLNIEVDKLSMENKSLSEPIMEKLVQISQAIAALASDINMISRRLHPTSLDILGLARSIETECNNFSRLREIPVSLDLGDTIQSPSKEISLSIYRILQECLRNIVRHAKATHVQVSLSRENHTLKLMIKDNGIGFDPALHSKGDSLGIASMTERARLIQGDLFIKSQGGKGTTIELTVPLESTTTRETDGLNFRS